MKEVSGWSYRCDESIEADAAHQIVDCPTQIFYIDYLARLAISASVRQNTLNEQAVKDFI